MSYKLYNYKHEWRKDGELYSNENQPAIIRDNCTQEWYQNYFGFC